jgi:hypothetical protein
MPDLPPHILRASRLVAIAATLALGAVPIALAVYVFGFPELLASHPAIGVLRLEPVALSPGVQLLCFVVLLASAAPFLWALWELRRLFRSYAGGQVFTAGAAHRLRRFAIALMTSALARPFAGIGLSVALTLHRPPGARHLVAAIASDDFAIALVGGAVLVIAWVMGEAVRVAEDNASIV